MSFIAFPHMPSNDHLILLLRSWQPQCIPIYYSERKPLSNAVPIKRGDVVHLLGPNGVHVTQPNHDLFLLASLLASCYVFVSIFV
jgi:hypothetical protein